MSEARAVDIADEQTEARPVEAGHGSTLPVPLTSFVGREAEINDILALLDDERTRLLTLIGPGGVGKTRLSFEVAQRVEADFADGVRFLSLASLHAPDQVLPAVARAYEVHDRSGWRLLDLLGEQLQHRHTLLVLDNYEHLLDEPPVWLVELLGRCPRAKVLVTSRVPLNLTAEHRYLVPPMTVPEGDEGEGVEPSALTLFAQRARSIRPDFTITPENAASVVEICRRLDGLPLAIELAAARISVMSPKEIGTHLTARSRLIAGGQRDAPPRLRSMRDAIAWGHDLLTREVRRAFRELAVFSGGFTMAAAEAVLDGRSLDPAEAVFALVDASLLQVMPGSGSETRFLMLETIQEFGLEQLAASGDELSLRHRHADWCLALVRSAEPVDLVIDNTWFDRLEEERANMVAAMSWLDSTGRLADLARVVIGTRWLWYVPGREAEGLAWFERVLAHYAGTDDTTRCDLLCWAGHQAQLLGRADASALLEQSLALARSLDDPQRQAAVTFMLAVLAEDGGDYARGEPLFRTTRELNTSAGNDWANPTVDYHLGVVKVGQGELDEATALLEAAYQAGTARGDWLVPAWALNFLALIACERGEPAQAASILARAPLHLAGGRRHDLPILLGTVGVVATVREQYHAAARLFGAAARHNTTMMLPERAAFERAMATVVGVLGESAYAREVERGRRMHLDQLEEEIGRLLAGADLPASTVRTVAAADVGLTPRENDVLALLAEGQTNRDIADALFLSQRTVANHVDHILAKLGVRSRTAAVAFAIRNGLA
jgi:non-specific serine/threonine protein kinase